MIKQIFDDDYTLFSNLKSNHYSRRIISHYGIDNEKEVSSLVTTNRRVEPIRVYKT